MSKTLQILFLHDITKNNKEVTLQNYNSFKKYNVDIQPIHDEDLQGLPDSFPVPLKSFIPRGSRRWSTETVLLNYILINKDNLNHDYYMFCEWDCYCNCDLNKFIEPYYQYDITAPHIVDIENESRWQWFQGISYIQHEALKNKKLGFRPSVFLLFKKESIVTLALAYQKLWNFFSELNSEARLGTISNFLNFSIGRFENTQNGIAWYESVFRKNCPLLHPVKNILTSDYFLEEPSDPDELVGDWNFARNKNKRYEKISMLKLNPDGTISAYDHFNEKYWNIIDNNLVIYNGKGGITTVFKKVRQDLFIGNYYNGGILKRSRLISMNYHVLFKHQDK